MSGLRDILEPIADWFRAFNLPEPIVHWGHPLMMGIVVVAMGSAVGWTGWRSRQVADEAVATKAKADHRKIAPLMFAFMAMGYTGGLLSLVMQEQPILESPHFWTGSLVLLLLAVNAVLTVLGFGNPKSGLRTVHAYLGSTALGVMILHAVFGLTLGLAL